MNAATTPSLIDCIVSESVTLPPAQQQSLLDYARFLRHQASQSSSHWDTLLDDKDKGTRFAAWADEAMAEGEEETLDQKRL